MRKADLQLGDQIAAAIEESMVWGTDYPTEVDPEKFGAALDRRGLRIEVGRGTPHLGDTLTINGVLVRVVGRFETEATEDDAELGVRAGDVVVTLELRVSP
jgi:hypothetical protein